MYVQRVRFFRVPAQEILTPYHAVHGSTSQIVLFHLHHKAGPMTTGRMQTRLPDAVMFTAGNILVQLVHGTTGSDSVRIVIILLAVK